MACKFFWVHCALLFGLQGAQAAICVPDGEYFESLQKKWYGLPIAKRSRYLDRVSDMLCDHGFVFCQWLIRLDYCASEETAASFLNMLYSTMQRADSSLSDRHIVEATAFVLLAHLRDAPQPLVRRGNRVVAVNSLVKRIAPGAVSPRKLGFINSSEHKKKLTAMGVHPRVAAIRRG